MSTNDQHTPEPWTFFEQGDADEYALLTADGKDWVIAFRQNGSLRTPRQRANVRRIIACVNACAGIPTAALEDGAINNARYALNALQTGAAIGRDEVNELIAALGPYRE